MRDSIETLEQHNQWRRGADITMEHPATLGIAIEEVVKAAKRYDLLRTLNPHEFAYLVERNIAGGEKFDTLVDAEIAKREVKNSCKKC